MSNRTVRPKAKQPTLDDFAKTSPGQDNTKSRDKPPASGMTTSGANQEVLAAIADLRAAWESKLELAVTELKTALDLKVGEVQEDVNLLRQDVRALAERTESLEKEVSPNTADCASHKAELHALIQRVGNLESRAEEAEGRARRNNIRIVGLPEGLEGHDPTEFIESMLLQEIPGGALSQGFAVERAHRALTRRPPPGNPPRPVIAKILNYRDRERILEHFRKGGTITRGAANITAYPDYTLSVQRSRMNFGTVKRRLREAGHKYMLLYPAKLKVIHKHKSLFFETPEDAMGWLDAQGCPQESEVRTEKELGRDK